jgi:hypothetical protein
MTRFCLALLFAFGAASAAAQPSTPASIQPSPDSAEQRQALRTLTDCLANARPRWARRMLSKPYLSDAQASDAALALSGSDTCITAQAEITFRTSSMVGSLAEHFLRAEAERIGAQALAGALFRLTPRNASEDFALCVASRDRDAARALALSDPGSAAELAAAGQIAPHLAPCTNQGEDLTVDLQSLRALVAIALYRAVSTVLATS